MPSVRDDSGLHGQLGGNNRRHTENGGHVPAFAVVTSNTPRETLLRLGVTRNIEDLNGTLPRDLVTENLFNGHRLNVRRVAAMDGFDRLAQFGKVVTHGLESATKSSTFHKREDTPSAIAGVQRIEECIFTKL